MGTVLDIHQANRGASKSSSKKNASNVEAFIETVPVC
jgi:hypothetical protein